MFKKVFNIILILSFLFDTSFLLAKPSRKRASIKKKRASTITRKSKSVKVDENIENNNQEVLDAPVEEKIEQVNPNLLLFNSLTNVNTSTDKKEESEEVKQAKSKVSKKLEEVKMECSGIKSSLDTIFGLSVATTVSSGLGTVAAGGALGVGIAKSVTDKKIEILEIEAERSQKLDTSSEENLKLSAKRLLAELDNDANALNENIKKLNKTSKTLGNIRTGLMAGATLTSAVSMGTSIGATLTATKLAEKMSSCNKKLTELNLEKNTLLAVLEDEDEKPLTIQQSENILSACTGYDESNIKALKDLSIANTIVSGIGTATAGAGTVTSALANTNKVRDDNSEEGKKKEKGLNLASNILAGVTVGTSGASTVLSAVQISKAKKDSEMAKNCEEVLAQ